MGRLLKSSLFETIRSKERGGREMELKDRRAQLSLLGQSMALMEKQEEAIKGEIGGELVRLRRQGMELVEELIRD